MSSSPSIGPKLGRAAGFGYLAIFVTGICWYGVWQGFRAGGEATLLGRLQASRLLFELSILSGAFSFVAYLTTAAFLYRRFRSEAAVAVTLLFAFVVGSVPFSLVAIGRQMELLPLLDVPGAPSHETQMQVAQILRGFDAVGQLSSLFWGLWLLPLAWIAWRSGGLGRLVGVFVTLGGLGYICAFARPLLLPDNAVPPLAQDAFLVLAAATVLSEVAVTLWLLLAADLPQRTAPAG